MIFYFSGTGNSFAVAKQIAFATQNMLTPISDCVRFHDTDFSAHDFREVGFVFPVYFGGMPTVVEQFVKSVKLPKTTYVYAVLTSGGWPGKTGRNLYKTLAEKGVMLDYAYEITMPDNYVVKYDVKTAEQCKPVLESNVTDINTIIAAIKRHARQFPAASAQARVYSLVAYPMYNKQRYTAKFSVLADKCIHCGLCERICPIGCVQLRKGLPVWTLQKCALCLGCINRCPSKAIQYGTQTINRSRYVHPILTEVRKTPTDFD